MDRQRSLAILESGELLRARARDGRIARNNFFYQATHGFHAQRQRNHVQQQPVVAGSAIAGQQVGLYRSPQRHHLVRINIRQRRGLEKIADRLAHMRHAGGAADQHYTIHVIHAQACIAQRFFGRRDSLRHQMLRHFCKYRCFNDQVNLFPCAQDRIKMRGGLRRQNFLGFARLDHQQAGIFIR